MENRKTEIRSRIDKHIKIDVIPGHFATNHSHVNYYIDMTKIKTHHKMAKRCADVLASKFVATPIDTIVCLEGTEMLGAFLAESLSSNGINNGSDVYIVTPELNSNNQMIFRDNIQSAIWGKNILLLISSASTGKTINRSTECINYYNGKLTGIGAIFSAITQQNGIEIQSVFDDEEIPTYTTSSSSHCEMCKNGQKIDAIVNSFGYSKI